VKAAVQDRSPRVTEDTDQAFVGALWTEHGDALLGHVRRRVGDPGRAEDIVQEVMLRAWRHADRLDTRSRSLRPWLFTVADHLATDQHRARRARPEEVGGAALERGSSPDESERTVAALDVAAALRSLTPEHRAVLLETYYHGRTVAETAAILGIPAGTVKSRAYYALRALRLFLEEHGWMS
jgi:RNA polymerase sigma-70 factor (ECF subfamily)